MTFRTIFAAAGLAIAALGATAPADAQPRGNYGYYDGGGYYGDGYDRYYGRGDRWYGDNDRWDRRDWRDDRRDWKRWKKHRRYYGWNDRRGRDCWRERHYGRSVLVCSRY
jgi:hypothetical protein